MKHLRHTTLVALASIFVLLLIGSSFAVCLVTAEEDCCRETHECDDPVCADRAACHCACAYSGVLPTGVVSAPVPMVSGELTCEPATEFVSQLNNDLFRPPRTA